MGGVFHNLEVPLLGLVYLFLLGRSEPHPRLSLVHPWRLRGARASADHALLCIQLSEAPQWPRRHVPISPRPFPRSPSKGLLWQTHTLA